MKERRAAYMRKWRANNPLYQRNANLKHAYGVSLQWFEETLARQNGCCAICGTDKPGGRIDRRSNQNFAVDHNHLTGEVRSLLCSNCNRGLGFFQENSVILQKAIDYLKRWQK